MKKTAILFTILSLFLLACKHDAPTPNQKQIQDSTENTESPKALDFSFIPTKEGTWHFHYQGYYYMGKIDTNHHTYTTISAMNKDTSFNGFDYHMYSIVLHSIDKPRNIDSKAYGYIYMRYDSSKKMICSRRLSTSFTPDKFIINTELEQIKTDGIFCDGRWWTYSILEYGDSIQIDDVKIPALYLAYKGQKYFYAARGTAHIFSIFSIAGCPDNFIASPDGVIRSFTFVYKSDSLRFEYPLIL